MAQRKNQHFSMALGAVAILALASCGTTDGDDEPNPEQNGTETESSDDAVESDAAEEGEDTAEEPEETEDATPALANEHGGFSLLSPTEITEEAEGDVPHVVIFSDPGCPACAQLEEAFHSDLEQWLEEGAITVEYRSVTFVSDYSDRAVNAFACMAEESPENYFAYVGEVTAERNTVDQLSEEELADRATAHGTDISSCISAGTFAAFAEQTTEAALDEAGIQGTPTIVIDGEEVPGAEFMNLDEHITAAIGE